MAYFNGTPANDNFSGADEPDQAFGNYGNDVLDGGGGDDQLDGGQGKDILTGGTGNDMLTGGDDADVLDGGTGSDTMAGGKGDDTYYADSIRDRLSEDGGNGHDQVIAAVSWTLGAGFEDLTLGGTRGNSGTGNELDNHITGNAGDNVLTGGGGNDRLDGGAGADRMDGGAGDDTYYVDNAGDVVGEANGGGHDLVIATVDVTLGAGIDDLQLSAPDYGYRTGIGNDLANVMSAGSTKGNYTVAFQGLAGDDHLTGGAFGDTLDGGSGHDVLVGGDGYDTYVVDSAHDTIVELPRGGIDYVVSSTNWTLGANLENLTLTGTRNINGTGNDLANVIHGNDGANHLSGLAGDDTIEAYTGDTIDGGTGDDKLTAYGAGTLLGGDGDDLVNVTIGASTVDAGAGNDRVFVTGGSAVIDGGAGDDVVMISVAGSTVGEADGNGYDKVYSSADVTLGGGIEKLYLTANGTTATGSDRADTIYVDGAGTALGMGGDDHLIASLAAATLIGGDGNDLLEAGQGFWRAPPYDDDFFPNQPDTLIGGNGDDTYVVFSNYDPQADEDLGPNTIVENVDGGHDRVLVHLGGFVLPDNVEDARLYVSSSLYGNELANELKGSGGDDQLSGLAGDDTLYGAAGNDVLDGGLGRDRLSGDIGNDTYVVDSRYDQIVEKADAGYDTVDAAVSWTLGDNLENLTLTGDRANSGTGNALDNIITGNTADNVLTGGAGNDILDGGLGHDRLVGGAGDDTYRVDSAHDVVVEAPGEGNDTVVSAISWTLGDDLENLTLADDRSLTGRGNALDNVITAGHNASDTLFGMAGDDILIATGGGETLTGGEGADIFRCQIDNTVFPIPTDTGPLTITDFEAGDHIDLSLGGGFSETFIGTAAFTGTTSEVRYEVRGNDTVVMLQTEYGAQLSVVLTGQHMLTAGDFILS